LTDDELFACELESKRAVIVPIGIIGGVAAERNLA
jgi:hypothetical protein